MPFINGPIWSGWSRRLCELLNVSRMMITSAQYYSGLKGATIVFDNLRASTLSNLRERIDSRRRTSSPTTLIVSAPSEVSSCLLFLSPFLLFFGNWYLVSSHDTTTSAVAHCLLGLASMHKQDHIRGM